jgi:SPP1 gp7 family putative phage head morphogenesis protein
MNYIHRCGFCAENKAEELNIFSEGEIDSWVRAVFNGSVTSTNLDINYYYKVARKLTEGVYKGFENELIKTQWGTPDYVMLQSLRENVYIFSAAKNYQKTKEVSSLLTTEKGLKPFSEFKKDVMSTIKKYDTTYLTAEYNSAIAQSRSASLWMEIDREQNIYNQLQYETVGDGRVRPEHAVLDNIIRPVSDKFWDVYYPPNGWNCRCMVLQTNDAVNTDMRGFKKPTEKEVPEIFRFNAGKTKQIFSDKHPYYEVAKADKDLARNNFNMPLPNG